MPKVTTLEEKLKKLPPKEKTPPKTRTRPGRKQARKTIQKVMNPEMRREILETMLGAKISPWMMELLERAAKGEKLVLTMIPHRTV